jgi:hypothetical protein
VSIGTNAKGNHITVRIYEFPTFVMSWIYLGRHRSRSKHCDAEAKHAEEEHSKDTDPDGHGCACEENVRKD